MKKSTSTKKIRKARVIKGAGRGKRIGIPTINFDPQNGHGLREGIYVCRVFIPSTSSGQVPKSHWGVLHFGPRPTFGDLQKSLEAHLFDFENYGADFEDGDIEIHDFIRKIINFESTEAMVEEIKKDIKFAMKKINDYSSKSSK